MVSSEEIKIEKVTIIRDNKNNDKDETVTFIEQYVKDVCDFSSQYGSSNSISYTAYNIAGNPSKFPDYGDYPQAFVMRTYGRWWDESPSKLIDFMPQNIENIDSQDYIDVEYHREVYPIRISIFETYNPGSVVKLWARDTTDQWHELWSGKPQRVSHKPRIFSPPLKICNFKTKKIRIEFNHSLVDYYTELDAVLLIGTVELILPHVGFKNRCLSALLRDLDSSTCTLDDPFNLTPDYLKLNHDLRNLKQTLHKHCVLYKSKISDKIPKGKLLSKLGLNCYCIPPIEEAFNSLQQFLQEDFPKLIREINISSSQSALIQETSIVNNFCGNFSMLPDETMLKILKNLDLKSLGRCCRVNKHFNNIARDALLYTSLNLKPYWNCIDSAALNTLSPRCKYLQKLNLSWCGNYNEISTDCVIDFLNSCGSLLTHLRLNCCNFVNDNFIKEVSSLCKNLKELCLRNCTAITKEGFNYLDKLYNLERLELYRTLIETPAMCAILKNNREIRHLNLAGMHEQLNMDDVANEISNSCLNIESIDFWKAQTLTPVGVRALTKCIRLREVDFGWCGGMGAPGDSLKTFLTNCHSLEKVFLAALRGLNDRDIEPLLLCNRLEQLDLLGARSLSSDICLRILLCCSQLKMIDLSFCDGISDSKVQEWRQLYPHVSIKRSFQAGGQNRTG